MFVRAASHIFPVRFWPVNYCPVSFLRWITVRWVFVWWITVWWLMSGELLSGEFCPVNYCPERLCGVTLSLMSFCPRPPHDMPHLISVSLTPRFSLPHLSILTIRSPSPWMSRLTWSSCPFTRSNKNIHDWYSGSSFPHFFFHWYLHGLCLVSVFMAVCEAVYEVDVYLSFSFIFHCSKFIECVCLFVIWVGVDVWVYCCYSFPAVNALLPYIRFNAQGGRCRFLLFSLPPFLEKAVWNVCFPEYTLVAS